MATETVTLQLSESIYRAARRVADATRQPLDTVLETSIAHALPPLDDLPEDQAADLAVLALLPDGALWRAARSSLSAEEQAEIHDLLEQQSEARCAPAQLARLQELQQIYSRLTMRKAHAYLLLARRGYRVPMQDDLG